MRLAHRLVVGSSAVVATVMTIYGVTALGQRKELIGQALVRETETLAHTMQIVANSALRNGQTAPLNRVLNRIVEDPDLAISAVLDPAGNVLAGGPRDGLACVQPRVARAGRLTAVHAWADCGGRVRLVVLPLREPAEALVIARRTTIMDRDLAASTRSLVFTSVALAVLGSLAILAVVRRWLTAPLDIMTGVRRLGGPTLPHPLHVPAASAELHQLAIAFNAMLERLEGNQHTLVREVEERIELERRLRDSESFAALGRLTGGVAHELGSPLRVIRVRAEARRSQTPPPRRSATPPPSRAKWSASSASSATWCTWRAGMGWPPRPRTWTTSSPPWPTRSATMPGPPASTCACVPRATRSRCRRTRASFTTRSTASS